jgi:hypothetical protein
MEAKCPKCAGEMEVGMLVDHRESGRGEAVWMQGEPEYGFFGLKVRGRNRLRVDVFRCRQCGFLESYATKTPTY